MSPFRALTVVAILLFSAGWAHAQRPPRQPQGPQRQESLSISGRVLFDRNLKEMPSVLIKLLTSFGMPMQQTFTRSRGEFEFRNLRPGQYMVEVVEEGYEVARQTVELAFGSRRGVMLLLEPTTQARLKHPDTGSTVSAQELQVPRKARKAFLKGLRELENNQPDRSVPHFLKAIERYPDYDEAFVQLALAHLYQQQIEPAQDALEKAVETNPKNVRAHTLLGRVYRERNELEKAEHELKAAVESGPDDWLAHLELAKTLTARQEYPQAEEHARKAHELNGESEIAHLLVYDLLIQQREYQTALTELNNFLVLHPDHPSAGRLRVAQEKLRAALDP
ncbi:MAG: tetratricopeptide repeat protein [Acidobacteria bacterium]|nr:tetratricopeptide repeat protein [Acidobacteriota bacterium]